MFEIIALIIRLAYLGLFILPFYMVYTMFAESFFSADALLAAFGMLAMWFLIFAIRVKKLPQAELGIVEAMMESFLRFVFKRPTDAEKRRIEREEKRAEISASLDKIEQRTNEREETLQRLSQQTEFTTEDKEFLATYYETVMLANYHKDDVTEQGKQKIREKSEWIYPILKDAEPDKTLEKIPAQTDFEAEEKAAEDMRINQLFDWIEANGHKPHMAFRYSKKVGNIERYKDHPRYEAIQKAHTAHIVLVHDLLHEAKGG